MSPHPQRKHKEIYTESDPKYVLRNQELVVIHFASFKKVSPRSSPFLKEMLRSALAKLPPQDAELFVLCYLEGYTYEELAGQFGIERGTIASRLHRIKAVLKKELSL